MAASLAEEQERKQTAAPLVDLPDEELRKRFARSILLPKVRLRKLQELFNPLLSERQEAEV
jgi:hypothetical protein